jgi:hypothetical protein
MGFALVSVRGDGEDRGGGSGGVQDEADSLGLGIAAGQGDHRGAFGVWPGLPGAGEGVPGLLVEVCEHDVGAVDLVAGAAEVLADGAEVGAAGDYPRWRPSGQPVEYPSDSALLSFVGLRRRVEGGRDWPWWSCLLLSSVTGRS